MDSEEMYYEHDYFADLRRLSLKDRKGYESLAEKMQQQGYVVCYGSPVADVKQIPNGIGDYIQGIRYLRKLQNGYLFVAYKNFELTGGLTDERIAVCLMLMMGSITLSPLPLIEATVFYRGRLYKIVAEAHHFPDVVHYSGWDRAIDVLQNTTGDVLDRLYDIVRRIILEGRWPEGEFFSEV